MEQRTGENENNARYARLPAALLPWYTANARDLPWRRDAEPYHVWLSEIMLQQTRVEAVRGYYERFLQALPTIAELAAADEERLLKLWEGLGYYSRARNLQKAACKLVNEYGGSFPREPGEIRALPGVGPYTAGAIASICFGLPCAAVDGNVLRIISRITGSDAPIDEERTKADIAQRLEAVYPAGSCGAFTQALMELGATVCTPRSPGCARCPAAGFCAARQEGRTSELPVRSPKKARRVERKTVLLLRHGDRIALSRRGASGLLAGLWQLPNLPGELGEEQALAAAAGLGVRPLRLVQKVCRPHIFTHIRWELTCYEMLCGETPDAFVWASAAELRGRYALPTAFRQFLPEEE